MKCTIKIVAIVSLLFYDFAQAEHATTHDDSITIFVHGTYFLRKLLQYMPCRQLIYCPQGLSLAKYLPEHYYFYKLAKSCIAFDPKHYTWDQFYIFGWDSEHVNDATRKKAAKRLVEQLYEVVVDYYIRHERLPKLRLIGYSHGGNVVLHMADFLPMYADMYDIDFEIWLFGTPVQVVSHDLVNSDCFTAVYSVYSQGDIVQTLDPQGLRHRKLGKNNFWSKRTFHQQARCIQIDFTVNGKPISHAYYHHLFQLFPKIKSMIEEKTSDISSGTGMIEADFTILHQGNK